MPIIALSPNLATGRRLSLVWGVHCVVAEDARDLDDMVDRACRIAFKEGFAQARPARHHRRPACRSARPARPTCCASPSSARTISRASDARSPLRGYGAEPVRLAAQRDAARLADDGGPPGLEALPVAARQAEAVDRQGAAARRGGGEARK